MLSLSPYSPVQKSKSFCLFNRFPVLTTDEDNAVKLEISINKSNDLVQAIPNKQIIYLQAPSIRIKNINLEFKIKTIK